MPGFNRKLIIEEINDELSKKYKDYCKCKICSNKQFTTISQTDRFGFNLTYGICTSCGLLQLLNNIDEIFFINFYKNFYSKIYKNKSFFDDRRFELQELRGKEGINRLHIFLTKNKKNLKDYHFVEIGCSAGGFLNIFSKINKNCIGYDIDTYAINTGSRKYPHLDLRNTDVFKDYKRSSNTIFILSHVLEHFLEPKTFLKRINNIMTLDDILYIVVPSVNSSIYSKNAFSIREFLEIGHITYFSINTLVLLLKNSGFKINYFENGIDLVLLVSLNKRFVNSNDHHYKFCKIAVRTLQLMKIKEMVKYLKISRSGFIRKNLFKLSLKF